jgi:ribosome biogenesis GTPase
MAKRKGKAQHRIRDWHARLGQDAGGDSPAGRQKINPRAVKLPAWRLEAPQDLMLLPRVEGMVVGLFPGGALVRTQGGQLQCGVAKTFRAPQGASAVAVGDNVTVALAEHSDEAAAADKLRSDGFIVSRELRKTVLARPEPRSAKRDDEFATEKLTKVIAANMDVLLIVAATCQPKPKPGLIDRFLIIAERGELAPIIVVNKVDLKAPDAGMLDDLRARGVEVHLASAATGAGAAELAAALAGRRSVLAGASGVGKSTLVNAMVPGAQAATNAVRARDERGRHTTSAAVVYDLPAGGMIVDTPGIRELGVGLEASELPWYFPEFEPLAPQCRFNDCTHTHEPQCAVVAAVESGGVDPRRYESYLRILETLR